MNPYQEDHVFELCRKFYSKYYCDQNPRRLIVGINPGRLGGGITGIPFTDPIRLAAECGIENSLSKKAELSSEFVYRMIRAYGGPEKFYCHYFISAVCPLGFVKEGKNLNYYDIRELQDSAEPFIVRALQQQLDLGFLRDRCYCLGEGKNFDYLSKLNERYQFFSQVIPLSHPRFIMQYRRKSIDSHIQTYLDKLNP